MTLPRARETAVELPRLPGTEGELWTALIELGRMLPDHWSLIGGQMVFLHGLEQERTPPRISTDLDALVNARVIAVSEFVHQLENAGYSLEGISTDGRAHRYNRGPVSLDVLAPEGLGPRADLTTTPPGRTIEVPGGTQALQRSELLPISYNGEVGEVPRPSLLGALVAKAVAVDLGDKPDVHRLDLGFLLSLVEDPLAMTEQMTAKDRQRLRRRSELDDRDHSTWLAMTDQADQAYAALKLLQGV